MKPDEAKKQLDLLQAKDEKLMIELHQLRVERKKIKKQIFKADFGCECDDDYCHTEKRNEPISQGETDSFCHDDQDIGHVSISCISGDIEIIIYRAVWYTFVEYDRKRLTTPQVWSSRIVEASSRYDQTNRVEIIGHADSVYNLDFESWDV